MEPKAIISLAMAVTTPWLVVDGRFQKVGRHSRTFNQKMHGTRFDMDVYDSLKGSPEGIIGNAIISVANTTSH
jgi:hypothetical protein